MTPARIKVGNCSCNQYHILLMILSLLAGQDHLSVLNLWKKFLSLCQEIGIPIKHSKLVKSTTCAPIHGIELDTHSMEAHLPSDKLEALRSLLHENLHKKKIKFHCLQLLLGHLNFTCKAIKPGRCILRRLYDLNCGSHKLDNLILLNNAARADLKVWSTFIEQYNGRTILTNDQFISSNSLQLYTDAVGSKGFACMYQQFLALGPFSDRVKQIHINILKLYPITLAVSLFGSYW